MHTCLLSDRRQPTCNPVRIVAATSTMASSLTVDAAASIVAMLNIFDREQIAPTTQEHLHTILEGLLDGWFNATLFMAVRKVSYTV